MNNSDTITLAEDDSNEREPQRANRGHWPSCWERLANDLLPARSARARDGLQPPKFSVPFSAGCRDSGSAVMLDAMKRAHGEAKARLKTAEERASRLLQMSLTLLTLALALFVWEAQAMVKVQASLGLWVLIAAAVASDFLAVVFLALSAVRCLSVDRVGLAEPAAPEKLVGFSEEAQRRALVVMEYRAAKMEDWSASNKLNEYLQASAWLTRGITCLFLSAILGLVLWGAVKGGGSTVEVGNSMSSYRVHTGSSMMTGWGSQSSHRCPRGGGETGP